MASGVHLQAFMTGLACTEGGRFDALNDRTGAFGKYQVMPGNWRAWANRYMGNRYVPDGAKPGIRRSPARHGPLRQTRFVLAAQWWLTGNAYADEALWSNGARRYVDKVMGTARSGHAQLDPDRQGALLPVAYRDPKVRTEPWPRARITGRRVTIRASAGSEFRILDFVRRDARVVVIGEAKDPRGMPWLRIGLARGRTGWIAAWFTEPVRR